MPDGQRPSKKTSTRLICPPTHKNSVAKLPSPPALPKGAAPPSLRILVRPARLLSSIIRRAKKERIESWRRSRARVGKRSRCRLTSRKADIDRLFAESKAAFGRIDILVNNAGVYEFG